MILIKIFPTIKYINFQINFKEMFVYKKFLNLFLPPSRKFKVKSEKKKSMSHPEEDEDHRRHQNQHQQEVGDPLQPALQAHIPLRTRTAISATPRMIAKNTTTIDDAMPMWK